MQVADGVLDEVTRLLTHAAKLAEEAKTGAMSASNRANIDSEFKKIVSTLNAIVEKTKFNGAAVFTSSAVAVSARGFSAVGLIAGTLNGSAVFAFGLSATTHALTTTDGAEAARLAIAAAIDSVSSLRASLNASMQRLTAHSNFLSIQLENFTAAHCQTQDANITEEVVNLTKFQILNQSGPNALGQTHQASQQILALLR